MQRVQKFLSSVGIGSRRTIEEWICSGRLKIDGKTATQGVKVHGREKFTLDGKILKLAAINEGSAQMLLLYHKPIGKICSRSDPLGRGSVFDNLPVLPYGRWVAVGRLDFNTSGILLFTNDGELAHKLMHPSFNQDREYLVRVYGKYSPEILKKLAQGVRLKDGIAKFKSINLVRSNSTNSWYQVVLTEGKNREIKRLFESQGLIVNRLIRVRFGNFKLPKDLKAGKFTFLPLKNVKQ